MSAKSGEAFRSRNPEYHREWNIRRYGITPEDYAEMLFLQGGVCAICGGVNKDGRILCIDHDHETNKVRGLLCHKCNTAIGLLRDDTATVEAAFNYLKGSNS